MARDRRISCHQSAITINTWTQIGMKTITASIIGCGIVAFALTWTSNPRASIPTNPTSTLPAIQAEPGPPVELRRTTGEGRLWIGTQPPPLANLQAEVGIESLARRIRIKWLHLPSNLAHVAPATASPLTAHSMPPTVQPVAYWPTECVAAGPNKMLVAGMERNGSTRIELWTLSNPIYSQSSTGQVGITPPALESVELLYAGFESGKNLVRGMAPLRGVNSQALVQFHDSGDLYRLNWSGPVPTLELLLAANANPGLGEISRTSMWAGTHSQWGAVYVITSPDVPQVMSHYVLFDTNKDGTFDLNQSFSFDQYDQLGLKDQNQWIERNFHNF